MIVRYTSSNIVVEKTVVFLRAICILSLFFFFIIAFIRPNNNTAKRWFCACFARFSLTQGLVFNIIISMYCRFQGTPVTPSPLALCTDVFLLRIKDQEDRG